MELIINLKLDVCYLYAYMQCLSACPSTFVRMFLNALHY